MEQYKYRQVRKQCVSFRPFDLYGGKYTVNVFGARKVGKTTLIKFLENGLAFEHSAAADIVPVPSWYVLEKLDREQQEQQISTFKAALDKLPTTTYECSINLPNRAHVTIRDMPLLSTIPLHPTTPHINLLVIDLNRLQESTTFIADHVASNVNQSVRHRNLIVAMKNNTVLDNADADADAAALEAAATKKFTQVMAQWHVTQPAVLVNLDKIEHRTTLIEAIAQFAINDMLPMAGNMPPPPPGYTTSKGVCTMQ